MHLKLTAPIRLQRGLTGRSARVIATTGMPALIYRFYFRAHDVKSLERNILGFVGIAPINKTLVGRVKGLDAQGKANWFNKMEQLGWTAE